MYKKILAVTAAIFTALITLCGCWSSDWHTDFTTYAAAPDTGNGNYYSPEDYASAFSLNLEDIYYFAFYGYSNFDSKYGTLFVWFPKSYYKESGINETTGNYEIYIDTDINGHDNVPRRYTSFYNISDWDDWGGDMLEFNETDGSITTYSYYNNTYQVGYSSMTYNWDMTGYLTNMPNMEVNNGTLEFSVTPSLSGTISRSGEKNGQYYTIDTFAVTVDNLSNDDYMYSWAIVPHNQNYLPYTIPLTYHDYCKAIDEKAFYSSQPTYIYFSDEWVLIPAAGSSYNAVLTPSSWHKITSGGHLDNMVQFSQINLKAGQEYDILCFGVPLAAPYASYLSTWYYQDNENAVDFTQTELFYSSTFSIIDPAQFDSDTRGFGAYSWDNDHLYRNTDWSMKTYAYKDENGNTVFQENKTTDFNLTAHPINGFNYNSGSRNKFDTLTSNTDNFFTACARVFGYFPNDCYLILSLGLAGLVSVAIFKAVIK